MTIIEDFEDGTVGSAPPSYGGNTGGFEISDDVAFDGSQSLKHTDTSAPSSEIIQDTDVTVAQGDSVEVRFQPTTTNDFQLGEFLFGIQDEDDSWSGYAVFMRVYDTSSDDLELQKGTDKTAFDGSVLAGQANVSYDVDAWNRIFIDWANDGTLDVTIEDSTGTQIATVSATDTTYTSGGIGFLGYNQFAYWDAVDKNPSTSLTVSPPVSTSTITTPEPSIGGAGTASVSTPEQTATAATPTPTVSGAGAAAVTTPEQTAAAATPAPAVSGAGVTVAVPEAQTTGVTPTPAVSGAGAATVSTPEQTATGVTPTPTLAAGGTVGLVETQATAATPTPTVFGAGTATVSAPEIQTSATTPTPTVSGVGAVAVTTPEQTATATTPTPTLSLAGVTIAAPTATATGTTPTPTVSGAGVATLTTPEQTATAATPTPVVISGALATAPTTTYTTLEHRSRLYTDITHAIRRYTDITHAIRRYTDVEHQ